MKTTLLHPTRQPNGDDGLFYGPYIPYNPLISLYRQYVPRWVDHALTGAILLTVTLCMLLGCKQKEVLQPCWTCTSFVTYSTDSPTFDLGRPSYSPSMTDKTVCDEATKTQLEKGSVTSQSLGGSYSLKTTTQTVCVRKPI